MHLRFAAVCTLFLLAPGSGWSATSKKPVTIDALMKKSEEPKHSGPVIWSPNGDEFVIKDEGKLLLYDVSSGKKREIIATAKLKEAASKVEEPAVFDWTNRRVAASDVQWFSDNRRLLVAESGDLFIVDVRKGSFEQLTKTDVDEVDPKLSPDNGYVSFRKAHDLYTLSLADQKIHRLTNNGSETLLNGELDWVYPEELDLGTAHWWSPDSKHVAYLQFDVSFEPIFPQVSLLKQHGLLEPERYPKAGDPNAEVRVGVVSAEGGETKWMDLGEPRNNLLARVIWLPDSQRIAAEKLTRIQNKLALLVADIESGKSRAVLNEEDPHWINVEGEPKFLKDGKSFLWTSERSGFRHLYRCSIDGGDPQQLTSGEWLVSDIAGVDEKAGRIYYVSTEGSPLERQLYSIALDGSGKQQLSKGAGTHRIEMAPDAGSYLDTYSSITVVPSTTLHKPDGEQIRVYRAADTSESDDYELLPVEVVKVTASDGTLLYGRVTKPAGFDPAKKYPAIVMVYGGPGVQLIQDRWSGLTWDQVLAHKGFVIWSLDNRGSNGRGHKFETAVFHHLGKQELADQKEGIQYLNSLGYVDPARLGLYGWSYGGFMTLNTVTNAPGLIKAAIAGAPVTSWYNYDSIYTERYMGLPENNQEAYKTDTPQVVAGQLETKLLMVHNVEDDNVHFANTMQMANAFEKAGKQFYMLIYPQKAHGVSGPLRRHLLEETTKFFEDNLK